MKMWNTEKGYGKVYFIIFERFSLIFVLSICLKKFILKLLKYDELINKMKWKKKVKNDDHDTK